MFTIVYRSTLGMSGLFLDYNIFGNTFTTQGKSINKSTILIVDISLPIVLYLKLLVYE